MYGVIEFQLFTDGIQSDWHDSGFAEIGMNNVKKQPPNPAKRNRRVVRNAAPF